MTYQKAGYFAAPVFGRDAPLPISWVFNYQGRSMEELPKRDKVELMVGNLQSIGKESS